MTSESHQALELLAVSHAIDVRLLKALVFGDVAKIHPFTLRNRSSYHRTDWAARAQWEANSRAWEVPSSDEHPQVRWRIKLNGTLHRERNVEITESFEQRSTALMVRSFDLDEDLPTDFLFSTLFASSHSVRQIFALRTTLTRSFSWQNFRSPDSAKIGGLRVYTCTHSRFATLHFRTLLVPSLSLLCKILIRRYLFSVLQFIIQGSHIWTVFGL
ncbi:hypothetical protein EDB83DRAFT_1179369 [Lactarius deliciosus]|nr:hypothetical protein EDB83DRAFT_1179369 [Lactarius deliciosus]